MNLSENRYIISCIASLTLYGRAHILFASNEGRTKSDKFKQLLSIGIVVVTAGYWLPKDTQTETRQVNVLAPLQKYYMVVYIYNMVHFNACRRVNLIVKTPEPLGQLRTPLINRQSAVLFSGQFHFLKTTNIRYTLTLSTS